MVDGGGLENHCTRKGAGGSNPSSWSWRGRGLSEHRATRDLARIVPCRHTGGTCPPNGEAWTPRPVCIWPKDNPAAIDMCKTLKCATHMSRMIQLRNVPEMLHRTLKSRAALAGMSLSDYLLAEIRRVAERPTLEEMRERLRRRGSVNAPVSAAAAVRSERDAR